MPSAHINGDWFSAAKTLIFYEITRQELWYTPGQIFLCHFRGTAGPIYACAWLTTCRCCSRLCWAIKLHDQTRVRMLETMNVPRSRAAGCRVCGTLLGSRCKYFNGGFSNIRSPSWHWGIHWTSLEISTLTGHWPQCWWAEAKTEEQQ